MIIKRLFRLSAAAFFCLFQPALAQTEKPAELPGDASSVQESHGDWTVSCRVENKQKSCLILQALGRSTGETVLSLELVSISATQTEGILLSPFGLRLADGLKLLADGKPLSEPLPFLTCVEAGCIVPITFRAEQLDRLRSGKEIRISSTNASSGAAVELKISLAGFSTAFDRARELLAMKN